MRLEELDFLKDNLGGYFLRLREEFLKFEILPDFSDALLLFPAKDFLLRIREALLD